MKDISWQWYSFATMSRDILYAVLRLRQEVFIVEQQCAYLDCDYLDQEALHLVGWNDGEATLQPIAYLRLLPPRPADGSAPALGRVLTHPDVRHLGIGSELFAKGVARIEKDYPSADIIISAQQYLAHFYQSFGFVIVSEGYLEDGIPHVKMVRRGGLKH